MSTAAPQLHSQPSVPGQHALARNHWLPRLHGDLDEQRGARGVPTATLCRVAVRDHESHLMIRMLAIAVFAVSAVLLTSIGGLGIVASPITLPVMYVLVRAHPTVPFKVTGAVIGGLTGFEGGWGLGYLMLGKDDVVAWAIGFAIAALAIAAFVRIGRPPAADRSRRREPTLA